MLNIEVEVAGRFKDAEVLGVELEVLGSLSDAVLMRG
jgi:hypothetical protein